MRHFVFAGLAWLIFSTYDFGTGVTGLLRKQSGVPAVSSFYSPPQQTEAISTLRAVTMAELEVEGGTHLQLINYQGANGIKLQSIHGTFENPTRAKEHLEKEATDAARIVKRNAIKNSKGEVVGERIEIRYYSKDQHEEHPALLWNDGAVFYKVSSPSRSYILQFEKWLNKSRPR
jgi:hypothetical protein